MMYDTELTVSEMLSLVRQAELTPLEIAAIQDRTFLSDVKMDHLLEVLRVRWHAVVELQRLVSYANFVMMGKRMREATERFQPIESAYESALNAQCYWESAFDTAKLYLEYALGESGKVEDE